MRAAPGRESILLTAVLAPGWYFGAVPHLPPELVEGQHLLPALQPFDKLTAQNGEKEKKNR